MNSPIDNKVSSVIPSHAPGTSINCVKSIPILSNSTNSPSYVQAKGFISTTPPTITLLSDTLVSFILASVLIIVALKLGYDGVKNLININKIINKNCR